MRLPKAIILDRDGVINVSSSTDTSPLYYVTELDHIIIKPGVKEALAIIRAHGVPTALATKQRCIGKGLASRERVDLVNTRIQRLIDHEFDLIFIEPEAEDKHDSFKRAWSVWHRVDPKDIHLFDDNEDERTIAARLGFTVHDGSDLYGAVCRAFGVR